MVKGRGGDSMASAEDMDISVKKESMDENSLLNVLFIPQILYSVGV